MSSIIDWLKGLFATPGHPPTIISVRSSNYIDDHLTPEQIAKLFGEAAEANKHYVRLWVTGMLLAESTKWFETLYPAVYSVVHLNFGDSDVDLANLAGPKQLGDLKPADVNHSLSRDIAMTGFLPFRGGTIRLSCGLAQMPLDNLLGSFLDTLGEFASKLVQPQISKGISIASSVVSGIQGLFGANKAKLMLYYDETFTGQIGQETLRSGFLYLSDQPAGTVTADQIWIINREPRIGSSKETAKPIAGQNYVIVQIELPTDRDDWQQLRTIEDPLRKAIAAKMGGKLDEAQSYLIAARLAAYDSDDLTDVDRLRVIEQINNTYNNTPAEASRSEMPGEAPSINLSVIMKKAPSAKEFVNVPIPDRSELLSL